MFKDLEFHPFPGTSSIHFQMILNQFGPSGKAPHSEMVTIDLKDGDSICCEVSIPKENQENTPSVIFVHGLGGCSRAGYLIRLARKFNKAGYRVIRVNLRGCCDDMGKASRPYNAGTSEDLFEVIKFFKKQYPVSPLILVGFSLGGNISIKLAGELGEEMNKYIHYLMAIGPTIDLYHSVEEISKRSNWIYHQYYLWYLLRQSKQWLPDKPIRSLYEFDDCVTAPLWGYRDAMDYYNTSSSFHYMDKMRVPSRLLFAADDPFIDYQLLYKVKFPPNVEIYLTRYGGHMGYFGWAGWEHGFYWLDRLLLEWVRNVVPISI